MIGPVVALELVIDPMFGISSLRLLVGLRLGGWNGAELTLSSTRDSGTGLDLFIGGKNIVILDWVMVLVLVFGAYFDYLKVIFFTYF